MQLLLSIYAWGLVGLLVWKIGKSTREGIAYVKRLHKIPCSRCVFFTGDYHLKCTVHPLTATSEESFNCRDFESQF